MQQQQETLLVQQWHTSYHQMEVCALFSHMPFWFASKPNGSNTRRSRYQCTHKIKQPTRWTILILGRLSCWWLHSSPIRWKFEMMSFYEMTQKYKKVFKSLQREGEDRYKFCETHPGYEFSYLMKLKHPTIPRIALPKEKLYPLKDLQLNTTKPTEESFDNVKFMQRWHYWCSIHLDLWMTSLLKEATGKKSFKSYKGILNVRSPNFQSRDLSFSRI